MTTACEPAFTELYWDQRRIRLEYTFVGVDSPVAPLIVFLHEGLGSLRLWRDFPNQLCAATRCRGLVYSRPGYGQSTPYPANQCWGSDFMHRQAYEVLPALLTKLGIDGSRERIYLFGHSDGASIAMLYASRYADLVNGMIVVAPHVMVEAVTVNSIKRLKETYDTGEIKVKFAAHHIDADATFDGWSQVWLDQVFRNWSIESELNKIQSPLLIVQGTKDEYGTVDQVNRIIQNLPNSEYVEIPGCGHAPHRTHPDALLSYSTLFIQTIATRRPIPPSDRM
ncbi:MAG: alpha/beta hydrolase [Gammaproteobacteria bacterium]|nr:alpha/beta hydrolase [Gammaproteobacteria bacterium]